MTAIATEDNPERRERMKKFPVIPGCLVLPLLMFGCEIAGNACRVGQELDPGQSCEVPYAGTFRVRSDGCAGEVPVVQVDPENGTVSLSFSGGDLEFSSGRMCMSGYVESGGFRASEIPDTSRWRIDSMP